jgi:HD-GYP domain-containing protein (c-di-GMP phosphodiesterase class II)
MTGTRGNSSGGPGFRRRLSISQPGVHDVVKAESDYEKSLHRPPKPTGEKKIELFFGLHLGATIHDIGKISFPAEILSRPGKLSEPEYAIIRYHPVTGQEILRGIDFLWPIANMVWQHHERCDGSGYPPGIKGDDICLEARIIAVVDVLDAIVSHRPYRPALNIEEALTELRTGRGIAYDATVVDAGLSFLADVNSEWHRAHREGIGDVLSVQTW